MKLLDLLFFAVFLGILLTFTPLALIWSMNTLFNVSIGYTLKNWFAALVIISILNSGRAGISNK
jgi:hypothetical protein